MNEKKTEEPIGEYYYLKGMNEEKPAEEKKTAEEAAYKFAEVILGQPAFDKDDTIVVGFLGGVEYAAQETAALREENERLKEAVKDMIKIAESHPVMEFLRLGDQYHPKETEWAKDLHKRIENAKKLTGK